MAHQGCYFAQEGLTAAFCILYQGFLRKAKGVEGEQLEEQQAGEQSAPGSWLAGS